MDPNQQMQRAMQLFQQRQYQAASPLLEGLLALQPKHPNLLYLQAQCLRHLGKAEQSERVFQKLIRWHKHPAFHCGYAGLLASVNQPQQALAQFDKALALDSGFADAHYNKARLLQQQGHNAKAQGHYQRALSLQPNHGGAQLGLGQTLVAEGQLDQAESGYQQWLSKQPQDHRILYQLGQLLLKRGEFAQALGQLEQATQLAGGPPLYRKALAESLFLLGETEQAKQHYQALLQSAPRDRDLLDRLFRLRWLSDESDSFVDYRQAGQGAEQDALQLDFAKRLLKAERQDEAAAVLDRYLSRQPNHGDGLAMLAHLQREQGDLRQALQTLDRYSQDGHDQVDYERALTLLCLGQSERALALLDSMLVRQPDNQGWWALKATALRLSGDDAGYRALYDVDGLVRVFDLNDQLGSEMEALRQELIQLHQSLRYPMEQSLRGGTQTEGHLYQRRSARIGQVASVIEQRVGEFLAGLPTRADHPSLRVSGGRTRFSGAWSVRLQQEGYHRDHFHNEGTFSACFYVSVPEEVKQSEAGWLKLGQPALSRHIELPPDTLIQPKEGHLALFPSCMWHGTVPLAQKAERMTIAMDLVRLP
ncbi:tetratricopeptide repeat protein [Ferrimonas marina]|uniref:Tfp pilus assembly protein PilF n=1 Tax=Ferrimonas marina TaxID=299255 RepID=A0A1M5RPX2_9GAMM|nr:tetratricopeptide repeat protein [Ferrimonas marina]SHH27883.1 Tfp pilus assembly protein PilF [Ferrimonas marina]